MAMFNSSKKRRIYDVTNVMEGVDIIEKLQNAQIKWQCAEISNANINSKFKMYLEENSAMKDELNQKLNYLQKSPVNFLLDNFSIEDLKKSATKQNLSLEISDAESTYTCTKNDSLQNFNFEITHR
ncbi:MAG: Transcription factor e2f2 [Marteilia pararefringens]